MLEEKVINKLVILLLNNNSNPNIQDASGKTWLHAAAELNSKEHLIAFINHWKFPIEWNIEDNLGRRAYEVSSSAEIKRMLNAYMKTSVTERYDRETRLKDNGSISKRTLKTDSATKSPAQSSLNAHKAPNKIL